MAHALSLRNDFVREHSGVLALSIVLHLALLVLLVLNIDIFPNRQPVSSHLAIQATVVDARVLRQMKAREEERQRAVEQAAEQRRQQALERQRQEQERREAAQRKAQDDRLAAQRLREEKAEAQRREQARAQQAREEQQRREAEQQKQAAAEASRKAEAARQAQIKADLARQLAAEEELVAAADSGELDQYLEVIRQKVRRNWTQPASARPGDSCDVKVQQIPGGEIVSAVAVNCSGDPAFARSVEVAVLRSSPLPPPPNPALFERNLLFNFKPEK